nr:cell division protein ZapA [Acuticoccus kandeliae]
MDGHNYRMACEPGDEERVVALATELDDTIRGLKERVGEIGDRRITVMAGLLVLDRLRAAELKNAELATHVAALERAREDAALAADGEDEPLIERLDAATAAVERITHTLNDQIRAATEEVSHANAAAFRTQSAPAPRPDPAPAAPKPAAPKMPPAPPAQPKPAPQAAPRPAPEAPVAATGAAAAAAAAATAAASAEAKAEADAEAADAMDPPAPTGETHEPAGKAEERIEPYFGGGEDDDDDEDGSMVPSFMQPT